MSSSRCEFRHRVDGRVYRKIDKLRMENHRGGADRPRARRPESTTLVFMRRPALVTAAVIPTTRSAACKFDARRGSALASTVAGRTRCFVTSSAVTNQGILAMTTVGNGEYSYGPVANWAKLSPRWSFKEIVGVGVGRNDNDYIFI